MKKRSIAKAVARGGVAIAAPFVLLGCAVATPVTVTSTQGTFTGERSIALASFEDDGSLRGAFGSALGQAFDRRGVAASEGAATIADFALSARSASGGIADPAASSAEAIVWDSLPREDRWFDECRAKRLRATLLLLERESGMIAYRGTAESDVCTFNRADFTALADALVDDALGNRVQ